MTRALSFRAMRVLDMLPTLSLDMATRSSVAQRLSISPGRAGQALAELRANGCAECFYSVRDDGKPCWAITEYGAHYRAPARNYR